MNEGMDNLKEIEDLKKEMALVREDAQIEILTKDKQITELQNRLYSAEEVNQAHQKLNGELQIKLSKYEDKAAHYRRKGVL
jgi:hypothetical protein